MSAPSPSNAPPPRPSRLAPYKSALAALSQRTGTPLPSLILSFAMLHELTALVPLAGFFWVARGVGLGERMVSGLGLEANSGLTEDGWVRRKGREWMVEGGLWAERVGRRYGVFGFEKGSKRVEGTGTGTGGAGDMGVRIVGDVANAVVAYGLTKALLPVRIGASLYFAPAFSRSAVEPVRRALMKVFRR